MESDNEDSAPVSWSSLCHIMLPPSLPQVTPEYGAVSPASSYSSSLIPSPASSSTTSRRRPWGEVAWCWMIMWLSCDQLTMIVMSDKKFQQCPINTIIIRSTDQCMATVPQSRSTCKRWPVCSIASPVKYACEDVPVKSLPSPPNARIALTCEFLWN